MLVIAMFAPIAGNLHADYTPVDPSASSVAGPPYIAAAKTDTRADLDPCEAGTQDHTSDTDECCGATCLYLITDDLIKSPVTTAAQHTFLTKGLARQFVMRLLRPPTALPV